MWMDRIARIWESGTVLTCLTLSCIVLAGAFSCACGFSAHIAFQSKCSFIMSIVTVAAHSPVFLCCAVLCRVLCAVRKGSGKNNDPMPAMMALPAFDNDVIKKLRKRKINSVAGVFVPVRGGGIVFGESRG